MNIVRGKKRQKMVTRPVVLTDQYVHWKDATQRLTRRSLISSCCFNFSKKDWKKSDLSTWRGATHKASMSAPGRHGDTEPRYTQAPAADAAEE